MVSTVSPLHDKDSTVNVADDIGAVSCQMCGTHPSRIVPTGIARDSNSQLHDCQQSNPQSRRSRHWQLILFELWFELV